MTSIVISLYQRRKLNSYYNITKSVWKNSLKTSIKQIWKWIYSKARELRFRYRFWMIQIACFHFYITNFWRKALNEYCINVWFDFKELYCRIQRLLWVFKEKTEHNKIIKHLTFISLLVLDLYCIIKVFPHTSHKSGLSYDKQSLKPIHQIFELLALFKFPRLFWGTYDVW